MALKQFMITTRGTLDLEEALKDPCSRGMVIGMDERNIHLNGLAYQMVQEQLKDNGYLGKPIN